MAVTRAVHLARLESEFGEARDHWSDAITQANWAVTKYQQADYNAALSWIISATQSNTQCLGHLMDYNYPDSGDFSIVSFLENHTIAEADPFELTWQAICEAWLADDFAGRAPTIAIIDKMRQILWDEPFNIQWAARPQL